MSKYSTLQSSTPLSLQNLARLITRSQMRDLHVYFDCKKLPLPPSLQDYVGLRNLDQIAGITE